MYLKSLEVHGFKSFANKLVFEFHDGITAIVGPNGSGKSNVADAVRWVLGEQSARQLRGAKMEDVIFSGTQLRRPLGFAYVAITISNEDHKLDIPYEEVKIARRVYRSGESEYLLNGATCRLRDVQELLFDTGIGKEGYSIIGQGQIDKILSGKPEERRELFDEAAGIVKYKKRKAAAERNLEQEKQNLVRIEDILSELEKQVGPLAEQSQKAKQFLSYRDELRSLDVNMFLADYDNINTQLRELEEKQAIAKTDLQQANQDFERSRQEYAQSEKSLEELGQNLEKEKEQLSEYRQNLTTYESDIRILEEQINAVRQSEEHYREQAEAQEERRRGLEEENAGYRKQSEELAKQKAELEGNQSQMQQKLEGISRQIADCERLLGESQDAVLGELNLESEVKANEQHFQTLLEQNNIKRAEIAKRMLEQKSEVSVIEERLEKEREELAALSEKVNDMDVVNEELTNTKKDVEEKRTKLKTQHAEIQQRFHMENSRLRSLKNMTERYEGFGQSIRRVMEQREKNAGIVGVVADIIKVKKEYELAVETALGGSIQNIVTDDEQTAKNMIQFLKKNRFGRATFLPLTNIQGRRASNATTILAEPGVIGMASTLVDVEDKYSGLAEYLLGKFVVVDHIDHAIALANKYHHTVRIVTTEGDLFHPGGSMSGGAFKNNNNLLGRRREQEDLKKRVDDLAAQLEENEKERNLLRQHSEEIDTKMADNIRIRQELRIRQNTAKVNCERAEADMEKSHEEMEHIRLDGKEVERQREELKREMAQIDQKLAAHRQNSEENRRRVDEFSSQLEQLRKEESECSESNAQALLELTAVEQNIQFTSENESRIMQELEQLTSELAEIAASSEGIDARIEEKREQIEAVRRQISVTNTLIQEHETDIGNKTREREEQNTRHKRLIEQREEFSARISALDKESFRLGSQHEKLTERIDSYTNYMWEQYELTYHAAQELKTEQSLTETQMKTRIAELKSSIKELGDVNVNAIEQYSEVSERHELLQSQHSDLIEAAKTLEGIIEELDIEMRKQFAEQFAQIRVRFDNVFKELFGGGRGTLELTEDEDVLQAGIRIVAQPPGKKLQNMMQLSGGEKALTAIALLFAIQSLKPSPFCLLDEIEAALDDSNVGRFADYLHKLTRDTQFIVITHRRGTMNAADILYGITMQEKGVSTLVSVNLLEEEEIAQ